MTNKIPNDIKAGDTFTITGFGKSAKGHDVEYGKSVKTGRKMKVKTLTEYKITEVTKHNLNVDGFKFTHG